MTDHSARTEIAVLDALGPAAVDALRVRVLERERRSKLCKARYVAAWLERQDHRTSSYVRRLMLDELESQGGQGAGVARVWESPPLQSCATTIPCDASKAQSRVGEANLDHNRL